MTDGSAPQMKPIDELIAHGYHVKSMEFLREGWRSFLRYPIGFVGFALIFTVASQVVPLIAPHFGQFLSIVLQVLMMAGIALVVWKLIGRGSPAFADFFPSWHAVGKLLICTIIGLLLIVFGLFLFVIPGIYLLVAYTFSYMLIIDRDLPVWEALETSRRVVNKNWWGVSGLLGLMGLLMMGGMLLFAVIFGIPLGACLDYYYSPVNIADLIDDPPLWLGELNITVNLGFLIGMVSGGMLGLGLGTALAGCMFGIAYADIFGLKDHPPILFP